MSVRAFLPLAATLFHLLGTPAVAEPAQVCQTPLVRNEDVARDVFAAIEKNFGGPPPESTGISVSDEGETWLVSRDGPSGHSNPDGTYTKYFGGGQMTLRINKCSAAILLVTFAR